MNERGEVGLAVLLVVLALAACEPARQLDYHLATPPIEADVASADPDRLAAGADLEWIDGVFAPLAGGRIVLRRSVRPVLALRLEEVRAVEIREGIPRPTLATETETATGGEANGSWRVELALEPGAAERLRALRERHPGLFLLVREDGRDIDYGPLALLPADRLPGGSFATLADAEAYYGVGAGSGQAGGRVPDLVVVEPLSDAERAGWSERNRALLDHAIWLRACEPERLEGGDPELADLARRIDRDPVLARRVADVDCDAPAAGWSEPSRLDAPALRP